MWISFIKSSLYLSLISLLIVIDLKWLSLFLKTCFGGQHVVDAWQLPLLPSWNEWRGLGGVWVRMRDHVDNRQWAASTPCYCMRSALQDWSQARPAELHSWARPKRWPTEQVHPLPTHTSQSLGWPLCSTYIICFQLQYLKSPLWILLIWQFPWFSGLTLTWTLLSRHIPACQLPL